MEVQRGEATRKIWYSGCNAMCCIDMLSTLTPLGQAKCHQQRVIEMTRLGCEFGNIASDGQFSFLIHSESLLIPGSGCEMHIFHVC